MSAIKAGTYYERNRDKVIARTIAYRQRRSDWWKNYAKAYRESDAGRFDKTRGNAKKKSRIFAITLQQFKALISLPCDYCGGPNITRGLDRVDPALGYILGNVVSCCWRCNDCKGSRTRSDFIDMCLKVAGHQARKL